MKHAPRILTYLRPYLPGLFLSLLFTLLFTAANIYFLPLTRDIISELSSKQLDRINNQILNAIGLYSLRLVAQYCQLYVMAKVSFRILIDVRVDLYRKLQSLSQHYFSESKVGDMLSRLFNDADKIRDILMMSLGEATPQLLTGIGILVYLLVMNTYLTLFTMISLPIFVWLISRTSERLKRLSHGFQRKAADITHIAQETLVNIKAVQANTMENEEVEKFKRENVKSFLSSMKIKKIQYRLEPFVSFLQFLVIALVLWYGGYQIAEGAMTGANLAAFFTGILLLIDPVLAVSRVYSSIQQSLASVERVFEILDKPSTITSPPLPTSLASIQGHLRFENVGFWYTESHPVLKNITIDAPEGSITALVGLSGAGKSTLINLIPRFYDPTQGKITVDGVNIRDLDLAFLRSHLAIVPQEDVLFRGTVIDNVRYGKPHATEQEVLQALEMANAWEFVQTLPGQLLARIGDRGQKLSGGQKQRLSIARALLRNPKILILDEATSALDSRSETLVQTALQTLMAKRTTVVIAHRLSTIQHAHQILVLDHGEIKERGSHQELLDKNGVYAKLYHMQFAKKTTHS